MARRINQFRTSLVRGNARPVHWGISMQTSARVAVPANSKVLLISTLGALSTPITVIRTRGFFSVNTDQVAASEDQIGAFGIAVVNARARAAGVASIPGPFTDAIWDGWFVYQSFGQQFTFLTAAGFDPLSAVRYEIDSKAMRKVEGSDEDIVMVIENAHATNGFEVMFNTRFLVKDA